MNNIKNQSERNILIRNSKKIECNVSFASNEIMLNRIFNGDKFEFPFLNYLK